VGLFDTIMLFDVRTMLGILFWINLFLGGVILTFNIITKTEQDKEYIRKAIITRFSFTVTYFLLLLGFGNFLPRIVSVNLGTSLLFFSLYLDAHLLLLFSSGDGKARQIVMKVILTAGIIVFNILEIIFESETIRTIASTSVIIAMYAVPVVLIMNKANSGFKRAVGIFYIFFIVTLFPRMIVPMSETGSSPHKNAITLSAVYMSLVTIMVIGTIIVLLFIKERSDARLENMAMNDQLTQIPNRRCFYLNANPLFLKCQREKHELALMFMDIDHFKKVNDGYGHDFGDVVLKRFALVLKESARQYDLLCRYGGEEFLVMLQSDEPTIAQTLARRIMERLKSESFGEQPDFRVTVSVGIAAGIPGNGDTLDGFIKNADTALYTAKNNGRNRIELFKTV